MIRQQFFVQIVSALLIVISLAGCIQPIQPLPIIDLLTTPASTRSEVKATSTPDQLYTKTSAAVAITSATSSVPISTVAMSAPLATIIGRAYWVENEKPVTDVNIALSLDEKRFETTADSEGNYSFHSLRPGNYRVALTWSLGQQSEWPCTNFTMKTDFGENWLIATGERANGEQVQIAIGFNELSIAPATKYADMKFSCK